MGKTRIPLNKMANGSIHIQTGHVYGDGFHDVEWHEPQPEERPVQEAQIIDISPRLPRNEDPV